MRFWLAILGVAIGFILWLLGWAWYTWGFLGAMLLLISVLGLLGWISDRRVRKRYEGLSE